MESKNIKLLNGDCLEVLKGFEDNSVDSIVTDPPAGIAFMGKDWDKDKGGRDEWINWMAQVAEQCLRVIKPGGHALVWAIPRTSHWTGMAWENAGWECRDKVYHVFGQGFPKSLNISKVIDKMAGAEREVIGTRTSAFGDTDESETEDGRNLWCKKSTKEVPLTGGAVTKEAQQWDGWGTSLKPSTEEWWLFRKPLEGTVANNVLKYGTGGMNIDGCRIKTDEKLMVNKLEKWSGFGQEKRPDYEATENTKGRWPAQLVLSYDDYKYQLRDDVTLEELCILVRWLDAQGKL